jgi:hypothetical protein
MDLTGTANTVAIDTNTNVPLTIGSTVLVVQLGTGVTTVDAVNGVTLNGTNDASKSLSARYSAATVQKVSTDGWIIFGGIA